MFYYLRELFTSALADGFSLESEWQQVSSIIIIIIIILLIWEFFTPELADCFSMESEWQQVSSSLQDSSQYFGRSQ